LLFDSSSGVPLFYWDPRDETYWECTEFVDHSSRLRPVSRQYIETHYPTVDCDKRLRVDHPNV
jgi:hypothetical protein